MEYPEFLLIGLHGSPNLGATKLRGNRAINHHFEGPTAARPTVFIFVNHHFFRIFGVDFQTAGFWLKHYSCQYWLSPVTMVSESAGNQTKYQV